MRRNKRVRMLVNYAKDQKIMEPFSKTMKMKTDSVDRYGKDEPPMPQKIRNYEIDTEKTTKSTATTDIKNCSPDDSHVKQNIDEEPMLQTNRTVEKEIIPKGSATTNGKIEALADCQEKQNYVRSRTLSSSSSSSSCSTCSSSSSSSASSSSSSSSNPDNSTAKISSSLKSQQLSSVPGSHESTISQPEISEDQSVRPLCDDLIPQSNTSKIEAKKSSEQTENANNLETNNNIARNLESTDYVDILPDKFGDNDLPNKCTSQLRRLSTDSTISESIIIQQHEFTPQQEKKSNSLTSQIRDELITQPIISKLDSTKASKQIENANNLETDNDIARNLKSIECEDILPQECGDYDLSDQRTSQPRRLSTDSTASESIIIQRQEFTPQQGNRSVPLTSPIRDDFITQPSTSKYDSTKASKQTENQKNTENRNVATDLESTDSGDFSPDDGDDDYVPEKRKRLSKSRSLLSRSLSESDSTASESVLVQRPELNNVISRDDQGIDESPSRSPNQNRKKRMRDVESWIKSKTKLLKNSGQQYTSRTGKIIPAKVMKPPCSDKCKFSCSQKFTDEKRREIFDMYWALSSLQRQRDFLNSAVNILKLSHRQLKPGLAKNKKPFTSCFIVNDGKNERVCKIFLLNTLGIADRTLRTVIENKTRDDYLGVAPSDKRGKHGKQLKIDPEVLESVRVHINSISRIESHYLRAHTTREYIDGGLTVADLHRDYKTMRESSNQVAATYDAYFRVFNNEFNISFFVPKKDQCDLCESYKNAIGEDKQNLEDKYNEHLRQKELSRDEKKKDKKACKSAGSNEIVAFYDLQAVLPVPIGESSAFFYKSKLNCLNLTITNVKNDKTDCYFWHEALGNRGPNEIGSCVFKFLQDVSEKQPDSHIIS